jgi:signal transduction histidine kinase
MSLLLGVTMKRFFLRTGNIGSGVQITNGHTLALLRSKSDRFTLFSESAQCLKQSNCAMVLSVSDSCLDEVLEELNASARNRPDVGNAIPISVHSPSEFLVEGKFNPKRAVERMQQQWRSEVDRGLSSVCFIIEMNAFDLQDAYSLSVFESALEEFSAGFACSVVTFYNLEGNRGRLSEVLRAPKQIWLDGELLANPYYTPAGELFGPESKAALFNQMLEYVLDRRERDSLLDNEDLLRALFREIDVGFALFEVRGNELGEYDFVVVQNNPVMEDINGVQTGHMIGKRAERFFPTDSEDVIDVFCETASTGMSARFERYKEDIRRSFEIIAFRPKQGLCAALVTDITERKRLEETKQKSEFRIRQTQKMEAIGRLASGVAHDFNNILTAIVGLTNVLMEELPENSTQWEDASEIKKAADRAAALTRQLLAFSRKQEVSPKVVNLNRIIEDSYKMLSRIIGEDIRLTFVPGEHLNPIKIDPGHMEQVLANFAANSRDAMPHGGEIVLETRNIAVKEHHISVHGELMPGNYVMLSARDTGVGMTEDIQERIFEPFFTTKEKGKGTGLGLATVYGIVRQHDGTILVRSAPDKGTSFEVYFPWADSVIADTPVDLFRPSTFGNNATVLLAEDEETVRNLTTRILERNGYRVISAASGEDAIKLWPTNLHRVDFLLTDVIMPGMNGLELYKRLKQDKPDLKVLYISGYPEDVIADQGVTDSTVQLLEKPFSPTKLLSKIQEILIEM